MDIKNIEKNNLNLQPIIKELLQKISTDRAILFVGAGFSKSAINIEQNTLPMAKKLSDKIGKLGDFDAEGDLKYAADYYLANNDSNKLIQLLKK